MIKNAYANKLLCVKNPWLDYANAIFFVNPISDIKLVHQAKQFNIPTIGIVSNKFIKNYDPDIVDYPILGNNMSLFYLSRLFGIFVRIIKVSKSI